LGLVSTHSGENYTAKPVHGGTPQPLSESFDQSQRLRYCIKSFKGVTGEPKLLPLALEEMANPGAHRLPKVLYSPSVTIFPVSNRAWRRGTR
jgi:hypothetical protein